MTKKELDNYRRLLIERAQQLNGDARTLAGSDGAVREVPLVSLGRGGKRLTVIGGTYFRLLPAPVCLRLLRTVTLRDSWAKKSGS